MQIAFADTLPADAAAIALPVRKGAAPALQGLVSMILMRTLRNDYARYASEEARQRPSGPRAARGAAR